MSAPSQPTQPVAVDYVAELNNLVAEDRARAERIIRAGLAVELSHELRSRTQEAAVRAEIQTVMVEYLDTLFAGV